MGTSRIFGPNYPEISGSQLNPLIENIIFEHLKEGITLIRKEKTNHATPVNLDFFEDAWKQLKKFSLNFSSCNPFPSSPSTAKDTC